MGKSPACQKMRQPNRLAVAGRAWNATAGCYRPPARSGLIGHHNALDTLAQLKRAGEQGLVHDAEGLLHLFPVNRSILIDSLPLQAAAGGVAGAVCRFKVELQQPVKPQLAFAAEPGERPQPRRCVFLGKIGSTCEISCVTCSR